jgi:hypothetical protein
MKTSSFMKRLIDATSNVSSKSIPQGRALYCGHCWSNMTNLDALSNTERGADQAVNGERGACSYFRCVISY